MKYLVYVSIFCLGIYFAKTDVYKDFEKRVLNTKNSVEKTIDKSKDSVEDVIESAEDSLKSAKKNFNKTTSWHYLKKEVPFNTKTNARCLKNNGVYFCQGNEKMKKELLSQL